MTDQASAGTPARETARRGRVPAGRSRRQLLNRAATGAAGAIAAQTLLGVRPAYAGTDGDVVLGQDNVETTETMIRCSSDGVTALSGLATGSGIGVVGFSKTSFGVQGLGAPGVYGVTETQGKSGVQGEALDTPGANGVYGHATNAGGSGVYGQNDGSGFGVAGRAAGGVGILGDSPNGTGVWANSQNATALKVTGSAQFSRSGEATVAGTAAAPKDSVRVSLPITGTSMMTAVMQKHVAGVWVVAAVPNVRGGYFTIYLNKPVRTKVGPIAWMVTERLS